MSLWLSLEKLIFIAIHLCLCPRKLVQCQGSFMIGSTNTRPRFIPNKLFCLLKEQRKKTSLRDTIQFWDSSLTFGSWQTFFGKFYFFLSSCLSKFYSKRRSEWNIFINNTRFLSRWWMYSRNTDARQSQDRFRKIERWKKKKQFVINHFCQEISMPDNHKITSHKCEDPCDETFISF